MENVVFRNRNFRFESSVFEEDEDEEEFLDEDVDVCLVVIIEND